MNSITYELREPSYFYKGMREVPIDVVGSYIEDLKRRHGSLNPEELLEHAVPPDSPIHSCFTHDKTRAAYLYNLSEARRLLRCYRVVVHSDNAEPIVISPANVRVINDQGESRYVSSTVAVSSEDMRKFVLRETLAMITGLQKRLRDLQGISPVLVKAVDAVAHLIEREMKRKARTKRNRGKAVAVAGVD